MGRCIFFFIEKDTEAFELLKTGSLRLRKTIAWLNRKPDPLAKKYKDEKKGWDIYYDLLDALEKGIMKDDKYANGLRKKAVALVNDCRIRFE